MSSIEYLRIFSDDAGCSHIETKSINLEAQDYAPPAPSLYTSSLEPADKSLFIELPIGWFGEWHPTPVRQWLILMTGECVFETGDVELSNQENKHIVGSQRGIHVLGRYRRSRAHVVGTYSIPR